MNVEKHIGELLYDHNCVIVPDLGGFVANYAPAKIHPTQHTFTPPSKSIVFNINLKTNDGLLANQIATFEKKSYSEALKYIDYFVKEVNIQLKKGAKVKIDEVGTLYLDVEKNIQFEPAPTNFLLDAFGLSSFHSPAIKRDAIAKRIIEKEFKDRGPIPAEKKKSNVKRYVAIAVALPLLFAMVWIPLKTDLLKNVNYSNLNPFAKNEVKLPEANTTTNVVPLANKDTTTTKIIIYDTIQVPAVTTMVAADTTAVVKNEINLNYKFHLVAGCFQIEENAVKYVQSLQAQNLNAAIIGQNNKGLYVVSCGDFLTRKDALNELSSLRKVLPNSWLYRN
ncbi:MAG: SPOR domain-containing protein [Bacteroidetes bacterium]|nr:SPOR domain-containing protein [Bacteroidota bacterium]